MAPAIFRQFRIAALILLLILSAACSSVSCGQPRHGPLGPAALHGSGQVYLVPIGTFPSDVLRKLVVYYREKYDLPISVLSAPHPEVVVRAFNEKRGQYVAEEITRILGQAVVAFEPDSTLIALTEEDIYIREYNWKYALGYRSGRRAVVSSARMADERPNDHERQEARLRKMVTKYIGMLHYRLPTSSDCRSPLYNEISGPEDLDSIEEVL
jgi:predicted Zn-dependent protease